MRPGRPAHHEPVRHARPGQPRLRRRRPAGLPRFSAFAVAGYDSDPSGTGKLGVTVRLDELGGVTAGALVGADYVETDLYAKGEARMTGGSAGAFLARVPDAGLQWLAGIGGLTLSGDVDRAYHNGSSRVVSHGKTDGDGYGVEARIGWTFDQFASSARVTPFASYSYTSMRFDGYAERGGPFPARFDAFTDTAETTRLGADLRLNLAPGQWVWGTLAWGHRLDGDGPDISGRLIGLFDMSVPGATGDDDWLEATAGLRLPVTDRGAFTASVSATVPSHQDASYLVRAGFSHAF